MGVLRTWHCLNTYCGQTFDSWDANPRCPDCQCVRVNWQPAGGHVGGASRGADKELRALADIFRMSDMNSAEEGRGAKKVNLATAPAVSPQTARNFGGFVAPVDPMAAYAATGNPAQCLPVANKINAKVKTARERALPPTPTPFRRPTPVIEYAHKGKIE